jgi:hypothetical protein
MRKVNEIFHRNVSFVLRRFLTLMINWHFVSKDKILILSFFFDEKDSLDSKNLIYIYVN